MATLAAVARAAGAVAAAPSAVSAPPPNDKTTTQDAPRRKVGGCHLADSAAIRAALAASRSFARAGKQKPRPKYRQADVIERTKAGIQPETTNDRVRRYGATIYVDPFMTIATMSARTGIPRAALCRYLSSARKKGYLQTVRNQQHHGDKRAKRCGMYVMHPHFVALLGLDAKAYRKRVQAAAAVLRSVRHLDGRKNAAAWRAFCRRSSLLCLWLGIPFFLADEKSKSHSIGCRPNKEKSIPLRGNAFYPSASTTGGGGDAACVVGGGEAGRDGEAVAPPAGKGARATDKEAGARAGRAGITSKAPAGGMNGKHLRAFLGDKDTPGDPLGLLLAAVGIRTKAGRDRIRKRLTDDHAALLAAQAAAGVVAALAELIEYAGRRDRADRQKMITFCDMEERGEIPATKELADRELRAVKAEAEQVRDLAARQGDRRRLEIAENIAHDLQHEYNERQYGWQYRMLTDEERDAEILLENRRQDTFALVKSLFDRITARETLSSDDYKTIADAVREIRSVPRERCPVYQGWKISLCPWGKDLRAKNNLALLDQIYDGKLLPEDKGNSDGKTSL